MRTLMREKRRELGLTQEQAAEKAGLSRSNYAHIERGRNEPSIDQMESIAKALNIKNPSVNFFKDFCDEMYLKNNCVNASEQQPTKLSRTG